MPSSLFQLEIAYPALEKAIVRLASLFEQPIDAPSFARTGEEILALIAKVRDATGPRASAPRRRR